MSAAARVLVIDAEPMAQELARRRLGDGGFDVTFASTSREALARGARGGVDVVLLASSLPDGDGWSLVEALRAKSALQGVPILLLAAHRDGARVERALAAGADDVLYTPAGQAELVARVRLCARARARALEARGSEVPAAPSDASGEVRDRAALEARLDEEIERSIRHQRGLSVFRVDLDRFGALNAEHGSSAGDAVIAEFTRRVRDATRRIDLVVHLGGDDCVVVAPATHEKSARSIADRVCAAVSDERFTIARADGTEHLIRVTACVGGVTLFGAGRTSSLAGADLMARVEAALSKARQAGPGRVCATVWA